MTKFISFCLLLFITVQLSAQHSYQGKVKDAEGLPMAGALIFLGTEERTAVTDLDGQFFFQNVETGKHPIRIEYLGFEDLHSTANIPSNGVVNFNLKNTSVYVDQVNIIANRLTKSSPFSYAEVTKEDIGIKNLVQDVPFLLEHTPSLVVTSDAGAGVGYTGLRLRGSDATRINVTINGVPLNDSESQGVFWVDLPDFGSSVENVQIQRGVGSSTNGAASFGGTVALNTCLLYTSPSPRDLSTSRMPSSA